MCETITGRRGGGWCEYTSRKIKNCRMKKTVRIRRFFLTAKKGEEVRGFW